MTEPERTLTHPGFAGSFDSMLSAARLVLMCTCTHHCGMVMCRGRGAAIRANREHGRA